MRKDLFCYYPVPVANVYHAFLRTAKEQFGKNCREEIPGKVFSFGLNYSFKYNMSGGALTLHFMPYQNGTAIAMRYTVIQALGARYSRHAQDMTNYANRILGATAQMNPPLNMQTFLSYESSQGGAQPAAANNAQPPMQNYAQPPVQNYAQAPAANDAQQIGSCSCTYCGKLLTPGAKFCVSCGNPVPAAPSVCPSCGKPFRQGERFCTGCGSRLM